MKIQPHFDYASSAWYPNLQNKFSDKLQVCQNKCIRFCLYLGKRSTLRLENLKKSIGCQFELDLNKMSQIISSNNKINWRQNTWMKYLPPLTNAKLKLDIPRINLFSPTVTEKVVVRPSPIWDRSSGTISPWIRKRQ